jgi:subtilase family serine protease
MTIMFSGTVGQVKEAFGTEIHTLEVNGQRHIANMTDPSIPAGLVGSGAGAGARRGFSSSRHYQGTTSLACAFAAFS